MPEPIILDTIPYQIDLPALLKVLHLKPGSVHARQFETMAQEAQAIARPKAYYKLAFIDSCDDRRVVIDGVVFTSRVLSRQLDHSHRAIAYLVTCGLELHEWSRSLDGALPRYWGEVLMESALRQANQFFEEHAQHRFKLGRSASMHPGSLEDWPITEQRGLFTLLGDVQTAIGVTLTESLIMLPTKSVSGLRFSSAQGFESCALCPRLNCPGRRAPYDPAQVEKYLV
ncbi:MAG: hypothetical protein JW908_02465 [Anaerolineales bacterium]|nr:hypothetical protein [Anaerolineales bacterium]